MIPFSDRIEANHVNFHQLGIRTDAGSCLMVRNSAFLNQTNYLINATDQFGPTQSLTGVVTNHPWANFSL